MMSLTKNATLLHQIGQDLAWAIKSPSLVKTAQNFISDSYCGSQYAAIEKSINDSTCLAQHSMLFDRFFSHTRPRVGDYFERLVLLWLQLNPDYHDIQQHIRIYDNKRSIGELDFLFNDRVSDRSYHWEVAIKYYLLYQPADGEAQLVGPNANDSFHKKHLKLVDKQLPLSATALAQAHFDSRVFIAPICAKALLKGYLFYPSGLTDKSAERGSLFDHVSGKHQKGWWTSVKDLAIPKQTNSSYWLLMKKPYWLSVNQAATEQLLNYEEIQQFVLTHFAQHNYPLLLAEVMHNMGEWQELSRGFVVNANWPNKDNFAKETY